MYITPPPVADVPYVSIKLVESASECEHHAPHARARARRDGRALYLKFPRCVRVRAPLANTIVSLLLFVGTREYVHHQMKLITASGLVERLKVNGSLARAAIRELEEKGLIRKVDAHHAQVIYTRATNVEE